MKALTGYIRNKEGVAATEFALMVPVLMFLLVAMVDYGLYINTSLKLENTARAAAEYLILGGEEDQLEEDVIMPSNLWLTEETRARLEVVSQYVCECAAGEAIDCELECDDEDDYVRRFLEVSLTMNYETLFPYPGVADNISLWSEVRLQANQ